MKHYFIKNPNGTITDCEWPVTENGRRSTECEITPEQLEGVRSGILDWSVSEDGTVTTVNSTRLADRQAAEQQALDEVSQKKTERDELKVKMDNGSATLDEIKTALSKLL